MAARLTILRVNISKAGTPLATITYRVVSILFTSKRYLAFAFLFNYTYDRNRLVNSIFLASKHDPITNVKKFKQPS